MSGGNVGFLHPGEMGVSLAAAAQRTGHTVLWAAMGRSQRARQRAADQGLRDVGSLNSLCAVCEVIGRICPPHAADSVADDFLACGYRGTYVDAHAIFPQRARRIGERLRGAGASCVDGRIVGGPAWDPGETCLYLAGEEAE